MTQDVEKRSIHDDLPEELFSDAANHVTKR